MIVGIASGGFMDLGGVKLIEFTDAHTQRHLTTLWLLE